MGATNLENEYNKISITWRLAKSRHFQHHIYYTQYNYNINRDFTY